VRLGLDESLEAYAKRHGLSVDAARVGWRLDALHLLHVADYADAYERVARAWRGVCRIAPGVAIPTRAVEWSEGAP
jgi:hypothetical protein